MKRVMVISLLLLALFASACQSLSVDDLIGINEEGQFSFQNLQWGMTRKEVEQALGISLNRTYAEAMHDSKEQSGGDLDNTSVMSDESHAWITVYGNAGYLQYQFREGVLIFVGITFQINPSEKYNRARGNNHEALITKLLSALIERLGDDYEEEEIIIQIPTLSNETTSLSAQSAVPISDAARNYKYTWENSTDSFLNRVTLTRNKDDEGKIRTISLSVTGVSRSNVG